MDDPRGKSQSAYPLVKHRFALAVQPAKRRDEHAELPTGLGAKVTVKPVDLDPSLERALGAGDCLSIEGALLLDKTGEVALRGEIAGLGEELVNKLRSPALVQRLGPGIERQSQSQVGDVIHVHREAQLDPVVYVSTLLETDREPDDRMLPEAPEVILHLRLVVRGRVVPTIVQVSREPVDDREQLDPRVNAHLQGSGRGCRFADGHDHRHE